MGLKVHIPKFQHLYRSKRAQKIWPKLKFIFEGTITMMEQKSLML